MYLCKILLVKIFFRSVFFSLFTACENILPLSFSLFLFPRDMLKNYRIIILCVRFDIVGRKKKNDKILDNGFSGIQIRYISSISMLVIVCLTNTPNSMFCFVSACHFYGIQYKFHLYFLEWIPWIEFYSICI